MLLNQYCDIHLGIIRYIYLSREQFMEIVLKYCIVIFLFALKSIFFIFNI